MSRLLVAVAVGVASLALAGSAQAASSPLAGTHWKVLRIGGQRPSDHSLRLAFTGHKAGGHSECGNDFGATYTVDGAALRFGQFVSTGAGCLSLGFVDALTRTRSWRRGGTRLHLFGARGRELVRLRLTGR